MGALSKVFSLDQAALHGVWAADELAARSDATVATGHARLDAELPGGGWPLGALIELLQPAPTAAVWSLVLPALAQRANAGRVVLVNPPHEPYAPALAAAGVPPERLLWVAASTPAAQSWASEQALRCQDVAAVLAWLPRVRVADLRRLQQAAAQTGALLFALRPDAAARDAATPARLRLRVAGEQPVSGRPRLQLVGEGSEGPTDADALPLVPRLPSLRLELLKRRGPPLAAPLWVPLCVADLQMALQAALRHSARSRAADAMAAPRAEHSARVHRSPQLPTQRALTAAAGPHRRPAPPMPSSAARPTPKEARHALAGVAVATA